MLRSDPSSSKNEYFIFHLKFFTKNILKNVEIYMRSDGQRTAWQ